MPSPTQPSPFSFVNLSGKTETDGLIYGTKWGGVTGSGTSISYSFLGQTSYFVEDYSYDNEYQAAFILTAGQQSAAAQALAGWSAVANITFSKVTDSSSQAGILRFGGYLDMDEETAAWAYLPGGTAAAGDIWLSPSTGANPQKGDFDYHTFVHEIGHALGLKHPFETSSGSSVSLAGTQYDDVRYTVMSYTDPYSFEPTGPMLLDIAAIQHLYGANMAWQTGNNTYKWDANKSIFETIWDAGGIDTIDGSNQVGAVQLNLNAGSFSNIGKTFWNGSSYINNGLAIAYGAQIENATGSVYNDALTGNSLNNVLNGLAGADKMVGGNGSDTYYVDNAGDTVGESNADSSAGGVDTVNSYLSTYTLGSNVENLRLLSSGAANGTGNTLNNTIYAGSGSNVLNGAAGNDTVSYTYATLGVSINLTIATAQATSGSGSDTLIDIENIAGSNYNDSLIGNSLNNALNGLAGADKMIGGNGSDIYYIDNSGDVISETNADATLGGKDLVNSYLSAYTLGSNIENLRLLSSGAANGTGNTLNNTIYAGSGNNLIDGGAGSDLLAYTYANLGITLNLGLNSAQATGGSGSDTIRNFESISGSNYVDKLTGNGAANNLYGNAGNDILDGGAGNDLLSGGAGTDQLSGGSGADRFDFDTLTDSGLGALRDVIKDFKLGDGDKIDLSTLDANIATSSNEAFTFIGTNAFSSNASGQLRFSNGILYGSVDADTSAEFEIQLVGVSSFSSSALIA